MFTKHGGKKQKRKPSTLRFKSKLHSDSILPQSEWHSLRKQKTSACRDIDKGTLNHRWWNVNLSSR